MILTLPDCPTLPKELIKCLTEDTQYYHISNLSVSQLCVNSFIESFIKKGWYN